MESKESKETMETVEQKLHILLCEDEESLGMLVREYLEAKGYDAELFLDGEEKPLLL